MLFCDRLSTNLTCLCYATMSTCHTNIKELKELEEELDKVEELVLMVAISDYID